MADPQFLWNVFSQVDKDRSGQISTNELGQALSNGTWAPFNPETVRQMIVMFDRDHSGSIDYQEFSQLWDYVTKWQQTFRSYDRDNSGFIDKGELATALGMMGYRLQPATVDLFVVKYDRGHRGTIAFDDFVQLCVSLQSLTNSFRRHDTSQNGWITIHYEQFLSMVIALK